MVKQPFPDDKRFKDMTNQVFGRLTAIFYVGKKGGATYWMCRCECGVTKPVRGNHLRCGNTVSCNTCGFGMTKEEHDQWLKHLIHKSVRKTNTGCWEWRNTKGYGQLKSRKEHHATHVLSYRLFRGEIPSGLFVCHHCDNPPCCNPEHLFLGTNQENLEDMRRKNRGRTPRGEACVSAKLTESQVIDIRRLHAAGVMSKSELASEYGVHMVTIGAIIKRITWKHIPEEVKP